MAQFIVPIQSYTVGATGLPSDFANVTSPAPVGVSYSVTSETGIGTYDRSLTCGRATTSGHVYYKAPGTAVTDFNSLSLLNLVGPFSTSPNFFVSVGIGRLSLTAFSFYGGLFQESTSTGGTGIYAAQYIAGTETGSALFTLAWTDNTWYWTRVNVVGQVITFKVWAFGSAEPASYQVTYTAATNLASGAIGFRPNSVVTSLKIAQLTVGTGGDTAPYPILAGLGSYSSAGEAATSISDNFVDSGSYSLSGEDAVLDNAAHTVSGSYTSSGFPITQLNSFLVSPGTYTLTGEDTPVGVGLIPATGSYTVTGEVVTLNRTWSISATTGNYTVTGEAISFLQGLNFIVSTGFYTVTGEAVTFIPAPGGSGRINNQYFIGGTCGFMMTR